MSLNHDFKNMTQDLPLYPVGGVFKAFGASIGQRYGQCRTSGATLSVLWSRRHMGLGNELIQEINFH